MLPDEDVGFALQGSAMHALNGIYMGLQLQKGVYYDVVVFEVSFPSSCMAYELHTMGICK